jgi:hypothetical protein
MQTDDLTQRLRALSWGLCGRAPVGSEAAVGDSFDRRIADTLQLIEHGEHGVAFEILAQNVYEFDVRISLAEYQAFDDAGRALTLNPNAWIFLADLTVGGVPPIK